MLFYILYSSYNIWCLDTSASIQHIYICPLQCYIEKWCIDDKNLIKMNEQSKNDDKTLDI